MKILILAKSVCHKISHKKVFVTDSATISHFRENYKFWSSILRSFVDISKMQFSFEYTLFLVESSSADSNYWPFFGGSLFFDGSNKKGMCFEFI